MKVKITNHQHNYSKSLSIKKGDIFNEIDVCIKESRPSNCQSITLVDVREETVETTISNDFTGFFVCFTLKSIPAMSTIKKALKRSKPKGCQSITNLTVDGVYYDLVDTGNGLELRQRF